MTVTAYRIIKKKWAASAFDGEGAKLYPGRWNSRGVPMIYTASSQSLAMLEMLVNYDAEDLLRAHYVVFAVKVPGNAVLELRDDLPDDWRSDPASLSTRATGDEWTHKQASAVLAVPSAIVPTEMNYLINPRHPDFKRLKIEEARPIDFDPRLFK